MSGAINPLMPAGAALQGAPPNGMAPPLPMRGAPPPNGMAPPQALPPDPRAWEKQAMMGIMKMNLTPDQVQQHIADLTDMVPKMGELLAKPSFDEKDVVKVAASAAESGLTPVSEIVSQLLDMPNDPRLLRQWVQQKFAGGMMALVQLKTMAQQMGAPSNPTPGHLSSPPAEHKL